MRSGTSSQAFSEGDDQMTAPFHGADQLPPQPDQATGQPRPPRAPRNFHGRVATPTGRAPRKGASPAPKTHGPALEWSQQSRRSAIWSGLIAAAIIVAFFQLRFWGFGWITQWWCWLLIVLCGLGIYKATSNSWLAAGSDWLQNGSQWVNVYELVEVKIGAAGANQVLRLKDSYGRRIRSVNLSDVQANQPLWDLVYNGILHSVVTGKADPPHGTRKILSLPDGYGPSPRGIDRSH
jgi:hypothetical protein